MALLDLILLMSAAGAAPTAPDTYVCMTKATDEPGYQRCNAEQLAYLEAKLDASLRKLQDRVSREGNSKFLRQRGIINGVTMHRLISEEVKPWDKGVVFDTMTAWTGDPREFISMNALCQILGLPGKGDDIDGSKVWDYVAAGRLDIVAAYCNEDVRRTYAMFERLRGIKPVVFDFEREDDEVAA